MGELVKYIAMSLVDKPDEVKVEVKEGESSTTIELTVAPSDMGKVIGKQGRIAKAIRTVVKAASVKESRKYVVEIVETGRVGGVDTADEGQDQDEE